jgi:methyltransferase of ATP-grasp peptide maturase system
MSTPSLTSHATSSDAEMAAAPLRIALAGMLAADGLLDDPAWQDAVRRVARHHYVPGFYRPAGRPGPEGLTLWEPVTAATDQRGWLEAVYSDETLLTQFDGEETDWDHPRPRTGGAPTSSSTLPSLVLRMWIDADLHAGQQVLEMGTGTGYSTALACELLGDEGEVTSIDIDPHRLDQAAAALFGDGYGPNVAVADGLYGYRPFAPYDRIVAAFSVRMVPYPWIAQTRPGGKILTTLSGWLHGYARVLLTVTSEDTAEGVLLPGTISFMPARTQAAPALGNPAHWASLARDAAPTPARHDPALLEQPGDEAFFARFLAQLAAPDTQLVSVDDNTVLVDVVTGSTAVITARASGQFTVRQSGPRQLWSAIETAWDAWDHAGRPGPETFRVHVNNAQQTITHPGATGLSFAL